METTIQIFTSDIFGEIRTCQVNNQIMFVGKDVAQALGYSNTRDALNKHVDAEDRLESQIATSGQRRSFIIINESGLYSLILSSKLAKKLQAECAEFARLSQSDVYWNLSHRAVVIAWLKACVLYVANGQKWEKSIDDFIRWSLNYDLWCKMQFFGADIEKANNGDASRIGTRGPRNLLELLPDEFTLEDARRVRQQQGLSNEGYGCMRMIRNWANRNYVIFLGARSNLDYLAVLLD